MRDGAWEQKAEAIAEAQRQRQLALVGQEQLVEELAALLFERDPISINFETNTDEYEPEAETIALRLPTARDEGDAARIVHEELVHWFDADLAGPRESYRELGHAVWEAWQRHDRRGARADNSPPPGDAGG